MQNSYVYILANKKDGVLYVGVTSDLIKRIYEHRNSLKTGFSDRYNVKSLVYFEIYETIEEAIKREKRLKKYKREQKITLIRAINPEWRDLYPEITL